MKICLIAPRVGKINGAFLGGSVNNVVTLSKELAKKHEVTLITTPPIGTSTVEGIDWCSVHPLNVKGGYESLCFGFEFLTKAIFAVKKLHKQDKFDIINTHSGTPKLGLVSGFGGKIYNISSLHTQYTPITSKIDRQQHKPLSNYRFFSHPIFSKLYFSQLDCVICVSRNSANSVKKVFNKRVEVIFPCVDLSRFDSQKINLRNEYGLKDEKIILFLGERRSKGIEILKEAMKKVIDEVDAKLIVIAGYEKENLRRKINKGIGNSVLVLDVVDIPAILSIGDIFVAPFLETSDISDIPLSLLEAMAAGKPVITSNIGGIPELIEHERNGILLEQNDSNKLAEAIISLLEDEGKMEKIRRNASYSIKENFSVEKIAREYERLYERVLESNSGYSHG